MVLIKWKKKAILISVGSLMDRERSRQTMDSSIGLFLFFYNHYKEKLCRCNSTVKDLESYRACAIWFNLGKSILCGWLLLFASITLFQTAVYLTAYATEYDSSVVANVQDALNNAGYECGTADGVSGGKTQEAIQKYQAENGLTVSGEIDEGLLASLGLTNETEALEDNVSEVTTDGNDEGTEKGDRGNPYVFGEDIPLGTVFNGDEWADLTICFDSVLKPKQVRKIDLEDGLERNFYANATLKVNEISAGDDGKVRFGLDANYYTSEMDQKNVRFKEASDNNSLNQIYSHCDYELNVICPADQSYDKNMKFIELIYQSDSEFEEDTSVWVKIPEYWNGEEAGEPSQEAVEEEVYEAAEGPQDDDMIDGMRVSFKEAMDSYEAFFDEYCEFITKYNSSDGTDLSLLTDYAKFMSQYADTMSKFEAWENEEMNDAETAYYLEVSSRILNNLAQVSVG